MQEGNDMYKNFRKFLKKVATTDIDMSKKVEIKGFNWSLANGQFWSGDKTLWPDRLELVYHFKGATPGSHNNAAYQAIIDANGSFGINGEGLNKRMDKLLRDRVIEIAEKMNSCKEIRKEAITGYTQPNFYISSVALEVLGEKLTQQREERESEENSNSLTITM